MTDSIAYPLTIYYDASCPLCATEMHALKQRDHGGRLRLVDCSTEPSGSESAANLGVTRADLMRVIHARGADGALLQGVDVFAAAYGAVGLSGWARAWSHPMLRPVWKAVYPWIANNRQILSRWGVPWLWARVVVGQRPQNSRDC